MEWLTGRSTVRVLGLRVPKQTARRVRIIRDKCSSWAAENVLIVRRTFFVRSRRHETVAKIAHLSGGTLQPSKLVDFKVWRPWWGWRTNIGRGRRPLSVLSCQPFGRWGNRVVQAAAGLAAAETFGAKYFILRTEDFAHDLTRDLENQVTLIGVRPHESRIIGSGPFPRMRGIIEANWLLSQPAFRDRHQVVDGFRTLRKENPLALEKTQSDDCDLVIHFRGTDQLTRDWRPPPLSYFLLSAIHSRARTVRVVTDDPLNSLVADLLESLKRHGFATFVQSSTLRDDCMALQAATSVCIGVGTFASSIVALSHSTQTIYSWKQPDWVFNGEIRGTFDLRPDIQNYHIEDATNTYIRPFAGTSEFPPDLVRRHMKRFPISKLEIFSSPGVVEQP